MSYNYDDNNIFAKILRGEIPNKTVLETDYSLAFEDISPAAPVHILVIPKGPYVSHDHFAIEASDEEVLDYIRAIGEVCKNNRRSAFIRWIRISFNSKCGSRCYSRSSTFSYTHNWWTQFGENDIPKLMGPFNGNRYKYIKEL